MVAFGKKLKESQIQEWQGYMYSLCILTAIWVGFGDSFKYAWNVFIFRYYINYKFLKKKVNRYAQQLEVGAQDHRYVLKDFSRMLDSQVNLAIDESHSHN